MMLGNPQDSTYNTCNPQDDASHGGGGVSRAEELLACSGGLDFGRFQNRPAALQKEPRSASQQYLKLPSWSSVHPRSKPSNGGGVSRAEELQKLVVVAL